jgi:hypothetical protein
MDTRRNFLKKLFIIMGTLPFVSKAWAKKMPIKKTNNTTSCNLYRVINGSPADNIAKMIELMGEIQSIIEPDDVVVIKPNVQWWNQGVPNLLALKTLVEMIMDRQGGFYGEVVLAENCHRGKQPWNSMSSGWKPIFERNADVEGINNYKDLTEHLKKAYGGRYSTVHWVNVDRGGPDSQNGGKLTDQYYNFHSFPFNKWAPGPNPGMIGAEVAVFMNTVRRADLNIITAEWVRLASRTEPPVARTRAILASTDPVALDSHSTKYVLFPNSKISVHNPDDPYSPMQQYLVKCAEHGGGEFDEAKVAVKSFDFKTGRFQKDDELVVMGEKEWGRNPKMILKYLALRYGAFFLL